MKSVAGLLFAFIATFTTALFEEEADFRAVSWGMSVDAVIAHETNALTLQGDAEGECLLKTEGVWDRETRETHNPPLSLYYHFFEGKLTKAEQYHFLSDEFLITKVLARMIERYGPADVTPETTGYRYAWGTPRTGITFQTFPCGDGFLVSVAYTAKGKK